MRHGDHRPYLAGRVRTLHGVDISEEMLVKAQRNVPKAKFSWYDGEKLPFADETFDVVVAICVLHHVPVSKRFKVVSEMVRVTRPKGSWRCSSTIRTTHSPATP